MNRNLLGIVLALAGFVGTGACCLAGAGLVVLATRSSTRQEPTAAYAPPADLAPTYPAPALDPYAEENELGFLAIGDNAVRGPANAPVTIHVVSDFQCPFCARVEPTLAQLDAAHPGQIRWVWHDCPLPFHADAMPAAEAAREVRRQLGDEGFWRYRTLLFENNRVLHAASLEQLAGSMPGIDLRAFRAAMASHRHEATVRADMLATEAAGGVGTPGFLINGQWLRGAQPLESFERAVQAARARPSM